MHGLRGCGGMAGAGTGRAYGQGTRGGHVLEASR